MNVSPVEQCGRDLQRLDPDRWLTALFAPDDRRPGLFALYAFNIEIARVRETVSQPMIGQIRLQWWREAWEGIRGGRPRQHPVVLALIDARDRDMDDVPFATLAELSAYASATSVPVMKLAVQHLGASVAPAVIEAAGTAYALTGILRATPHLLARRRVMLPADLLAAQSLTPEAAYQTECGPALRPVIADVAAEAGKLLQMARGQKVTRAVLPALLPVTLAGLSLNALGRSDYDPVAAESRITPLRRQMALLRASLLGRL